MRTTTKLELRPISQLIPYANNARTHSEAQIDKLRRSLREFGFVAPVLIDGAGNILAGHGRVLAAQAEGIEAAPCVLVEHLTAEQQRAYILADNRLAEDAGWDAALVNAELAALAGVGFDVALTGFDPAGISLGETRDENEPEHFWGDVETESTEESDPEHFWGDVETESTEEYEELVEKHKPKLTTDDCYTPPGVYEAVRRFAVDYYQLGDAPIIRPFYPGGDYQKAEYPEGCVVIDNPPFSILSEIVNWYMDKGIRFFLFAPGVTLYSIASGRCNYIPAGNQVFYENGANINTGFVSNLGTWKIDTCPELHAAVAEAVDEFLAEKRQSFPVYEYPACVVNVQTNKLAKYGQHFRVRPEDCTFIRALDAQKEMDKTIYGCGFLLSEKATAEKATAEKAAAEKAAATIWPLSEREKALITTLGGGADG